MRIVKEFLIYCEEKFHVNILKKLRGIYGKIFRILKIF